MEGGKKNVFESVFGWPKDRESVEKEKKKRFGAS